MDRQRRIGPEAVRDAFTAPYKSYPNLPADWQSQGRSASARKGDVLPTNNRLKHASLTDFTPALARSCALGGGFSEAAPRFSLCTNLTAPLPAFRRGGLTSLRPDSRSALSRIFPWMFFAPSATRSRRF